MERIDRGIELARRRQEATIPLILERMYGDLEPVEDLAEEAITVLSAGTWVEFLEWVRDGLSTRVDSPERREAFIACAMSAWNFGVGMNAGAADMAREVLKNLGASNRPVVFDEQGNMV
jgi:hypothetical protein